MIIIILKIISIYHLESHLAVGIVILFFEIVRIVLSRDFSFYGDFAKFRPRNLSYVFSVSTLIYIPLQTFRLFFLYTNSILKTHK